MAARAVAVRVVAAWEVAAEVAAVKGAERGGEGVTGWAAWEVGLKVVASTEKAKLGVELRVAGWTEMVGWVEGGWEMAATAMVAETMAAE